MLSAFLQCWKRNFGQGKAKQKSIHNLSDEDDQWLAKPKMKWIEHIEAL